MDKYSLKARLYPMFILFLPLIAIGISYSIDIENYLNILTSIGISAALSYFFSNLGRDSDKRKEKELWDSWGGAPTQQIFSYDNDRIDQHTKDRYHRFMLSRLPTKETIDFTVEQETVKEIHQSWTKYLITQTRDTKKFALLFKENTSYGFRRNLWGLKPFSLALICICLIVNYLYSATNSNSINFLNYSVTFKVSESILVLLFLVWIFIIKKEWVKIPAFAYAERLLETIDILDE